jgi:Clp amino terminal domain, pathogenicity island component
MTYRGEDLDLRAFGTRPPRDGVGPVDAGLNGTRPRAPSTNGARSEPLYVDDTVLACCNHAFDIAQAHGASEVRLEHLVHALTRVEAAAEILEQRGIREAHLRRESAAVIASEIPVGLAHSHAAPRSSVELEDVLRRSSDLSRRRDATATVHDLLWVLLNYDREIPAIALLLRHATDWQKWDWPHQQEARREAPRPAYYERRPFVEPTPAPPPPRQRVVETVTVAPPPPPVQTVVYERANGQDLDPVFNRLDQMDIALRKMQSDMSNDRRTLTDLLRDVQRDIASNRNSGNGAIPSSLIDRIQGIEHAVEMRFGDFSRSASLLTDRLQGLEKSVTAGMQEGARNWAALGDRLKVIDRFATAKPGSSGLDELVTEQLIAVTTQVQAATEKLQQLERNLEGRQSESQRAWSAATDRLRTIEESIAEARREGAAAPAVGGTVNLAPMQTLITDRFQAIRQQLEQQNIATASLVAQMTEPLTDRMRAMEQLIQSRPTGSGEAQLDRGTQERLARMEQMVSNLGSQSTERMTALERATGAQFDQLASRLGQIDTIAGRLGQIDTIAGRVAQVDQIGTRFDQLTTRLGALDAMATRLDQVDVVNGRLGQIEQLVTSHGDRAVQYTQQVAQQTANAHTKELSDLQEALVQLGTNQQTLSENIDQWRGDIDGNISIVSNRLAAMEQAALQPSAILKQLQSDMEGIQRVTLADYDQNRKGVRNWLFGTEDIFAGAWRDETRQIRDRLKQMRPTDERKV